MQTRKYSLYSEFEPAGDQPQAIAKLVQGSERGIAQTLLGVTGSGKTFSMANVIAKTGKNALVISHNKTLAAQLYAELQQFTDNLNNYVLGTASPDAEGGQARKQSALDAIPDAKDLAEATDNAMKTIEKDQT